MVDRIGQIAGSGVVYDPEPLPHGCVLPPTTGFKPGSIFECSCGRTAVLEQDPVDDRSDREATGWLWKWRLWR